jgi:hypothetical protein
MTLREIWAYLQDEVDRQDRAGVDEFYEGD